MIIKNFTFFLTFLFVQPYLLGQSTNTPTKQNIKQKKATVILLNSKKLQEEKSSVEKDIKTIFCQKKNSLGLFNCELKDTDFNLMKGLFLSSKTHAALLKEMNKTVGALLFFVHKKQQQIGIAYFAVHEAHHNKGYGKLLLTSVLQKFPNFNATLSCHSNNSNAHKFYLKNGFIQETTSTPGLLCFTKLKPQ